MPWLLFFRAGAMMKTYVGSFDPADLAAVGFARGWEGAWLCNREPDLDEAKKVVEGGDPLGSLKYTVMLYVSNPN